MGIGVLSHLLSECLRSSPRVSVYKVHAEHPHPKVAMSALGTRCGLTPCPGITPHDHLVEQLRRSLTRMRAEPAGGEELGASPPLQPGHVLFCLRGAACPTRELGLLAAPICLQACFRPQEPSPGTPHPGRMALVHSLWPLHTRQLCPLCGVHGLGPTPNGALPPGAGRAVFLPTLSLCPFFRDTAWWPGLCRYL